MEVKINQTVDAPIDIVLRAKDERFDHADKIEGMKKLTFDEKTEDDKTVKTKRKFDINMDKTPAAVRKMLPDNMFNFTEVAVWHKEKNLQEWEMISGAPKKLQWTGSTQYKEAGDKTERIVKSTIKVKMAFVGDAIEQAVAAGFKKSMEKELKSIQAMAELIKDGKV